MLTLRQQREREEKEAYWQPHIEAWQSSGKTVKSYCEQHDLKSHQFKYWRYQLAPGTRRTFSCKEQGAPFVEVKTVMSSDTLVKSGYVIKTDYGFRIQVDASVGNELLSELLSCLKQLSC